MKLITISIFFLISFTSFAELAIDRVKFNWLNKVDNPAHGAEHHTLFSKANNAKIGFYVYLPKHYKNKPEARYPVIYSLHGGGGNESSNLGRIFILKKAIEEKIIPPTIMVFPNGVKSSAYLDSHDGSLKIKSMILKEIIPYVDNNFRTISDARGRAVHGFSMGGTGSCYLAFTHPEMFSSMTNFAGSGNMRVDFDPAAKDAHTKVRYFSNKKNMLGNDAQFWKENAGYYAIEKRQDYIRKNLGVRIVFGKKDKGIKGAEQLSAFLKSLNVPHDFVLHEGGHNWGTEQNGLDTMKFHSKHFKLSDQEKLLLK